MSDQSDSLCVIACNTGELGDQSDRKFLQQQIKILKTPFQLENDCPAFSRIKGYYVLLKMFCSRKFPYPHQGGLVEIIRSRVGGGEVKKLVSGPRLLLQNNVALSTGLILLFPVDRNIHKFFAAFRVRFLMPLVCFKPITWYIEMHHMRTFNVSNASKKSLWICPDHILSSADKQRSC